MTMTTTGATTPAFGRTTDWSTVTASSLATSGGHEEIGTSMTSPTSSEGWFRLDELLQPNGTVNGEEATSVAVGAGSGVTVVCRWGYTQHRRSYEVIGDWRLEHRLAWLMHTYGFACLFFMLAFYAFFSILNLRAQLSTRPFMSSINVFLCLLGASRAICFLIDPYDYKGLMPETIGYILFELAFPCLVSAFGLIQLAFLQLTRLQLGLAQLRNKSCISLMITTHFGFTIATNIMLSYDRRDIHIFCFVTQSLFVLWGIGLCVDFLFSGYRMMRMLRHAPASMFQRSDSSGFENKVLALGMLANCHNLAAMTAAAAAAAPSFLAAPKIRITDENEHTYSYVSDNSLLSSNQNLQNADLSEITDGPRDKTECITNDNSPGRRLAGSAIYTVSEDVAAPAEDDVPESARMLPADSDTDNRKNKQNVTGSRKVIQQQKQQQRHDRPTAKRTMANGGTKLTAGPVTANGSVKPAVGAVTLANGSAKPSGRSKLGDSLEMGLLSKTAAPRSDLELKQDLTLVSILNHIAYVNQSVGDMGMVRRLQATCKNQVERVLHGTYASAVLGLLLCVLMAIQMNGPALFAGRISPGAWFTFLSIHRLVELAMGCFMANITKQPVNRHQYAHPCHLKHRGGGLYF